MTTLDRLPIRPEVRGRFDSMVRLRRDLHAHPELGFREARTADQVVRFLEKSALGCRTGIAKTGVCAVARGAGSGGRTILFRADMDGLPIQEESDRDYASKHDGVMHACGHDGHTTILLHTAEVAQRNGGSLPVDCKFVFQPAEEGPGGALPMIGEGVLGDPDVEAAFGLHLWTPMPVGGVAVTAGPFMAAADEFELVVHGRGGHGAYPHQTVDAVVVGSHIVTALQTLVSRNASPMQTAVVTVGTFHAGSNFNIIAETARMKGTLRTFDPELRDLLIRRLEEVSTGTARVFGAECEFVFVEHYPALVNDPAMAEFVAGVASEVLGPENVKRDLVSMGGEDMAYFLQKVPGCFFFLGAGNEAKGCGHPHHSPHFDFDEDAMAIGSEILLRIAERYPAAFPVPPPAKSS